MPVSRLIVSAVLAAMAMLPSAASGQTSTGAPSAGRLLVIDDRRGFRIGWEDRGDEIVFTAVMTPNQYVTVEIDGNRDGRWGEGQYDPRHSSIVSGADRRVSGEHGKFCGQYIYTWGPDDPGAVMSTSDCMAKLFGGHYEVSKPDSQGMVTTRYFLKASDIFGTRSSANLAFNVWDGRGNRHYFSAAKPLILTRSPAAQP